MKKLIWFLILFSVLMFAFTGFVAAQTEAPKELEDIELAWIGKTLNNPWWIMVNDIAIREAEEIGVSMESTMPQEEVNLESQVEMIESAIEKGVDSIIISAVSSEGVIPSLEKAKEEGINIINFDTRVEDKDLIDAYVGADDVAGSYKAGKYIAEKLNGEGQVGLLEGLLAQSTGVDRKEGFMKAMDEYPNIEVVATTPAEWRSDLAMDGTVNMLTANPDIDAIFACNDQMAVGMVNGVYAAGKSPEDLILVGYDGILDAAELVLQGELDAFVALPTREEGYMGVRLAVTSLLNPDFEYSREMIFSGPLVTADYIPNLTDNTIEEYIARVYPLYGIKTKGY